MFPPLPKRVHSALKILIGLADAQGPRRSRELSARAGIPASEAAKILYILTWRGLVSSRRGSTGGFWLRVPPDRIRVRDVLEFLCAPAERGTKGGDPVLEAWRQTVERSGRAFERLTLAALARKGGASR